MKRITAILFLASSVFALSSCGESHITSPLDSSLSSSETTPGSSSVTPKKDSLWGEELGTYMESSFGIDLPFFESDSLEFEKKTDDYGDPSLWVYLHYDDSSIENLESKLSSYATLCIDSGFSVDFNTQRYFDQDTLTYYTFDVYYADINISASKALQLQFLQGAHNGDCLGIYAFSYVPVSEKNWPVSLLKNVVGHDVPHYVVEGATYLSWEQNDGEDSKYGNYVGIAVKGVDKTSEETYSSILKDESYSVNYSMKNSMYIASKDGVSGSISFYYDDVSFDCLYIYVMSVSY